MAILNVTEILNTSADVLRRNIGFELTSPTVGASTEARSLTIAGQVASLKKKIKTIEINGRGIAASIPVYPSASSNLHNILGYIKGEKEFNVSIGTLGLPQKF